MLSLDFKGNIPTKHGKTFGTNVAPFIRILDLGFPVEKMVVYPSHNWWLIDMYSDVNHWKKSLLIESDLYTVTIPFIVILIVIYITLKIHGFITNP